MQGGNDLRQKYIQENHQHLNVIVSRLKLLLENLEHIIHQLLINFR